VDFGSVVQDQVHVLVEADDVALHASVDGLVQTDGHQGTALQVPGEDNFDYTRPKFCL
jgi:hypothetical protein